MPDYSHAQAKLGRAKEHIADVEAAIGAYLATDFYRLRIESDQRAGQMKIVFDSLHQPDQSVSLLIGDAVSNLRSALDYAIVAMTGSTKAAFPIADGANGFKGEVKKGFVGQLGAAAIAFFVNEIQAYEGGNGHAIWTLNKLRNIDKHRFLLTTAQIAQITMSFRDANNNVFNNSTFGIQAGASGNLIAAPIGHIQLTSNPRPAFQIRLQEFPWFPDVPVSDMLQASAQAVAECLEAIEGFAP